MLPPPEPEAPALEGADADDAAARPSRRKAPAAPKAPPADPAETLRNVNAITRNVLRVIETPVMERFSTVPLLLADHAKLYGLMRVCAVGLAVMLSVRRLRAVRRRAARPPLQHQHAPLLCSAPHPSFSLPFSLSPTPPHPFS